MFSGFIFGAPYVLLCGFFVKFMKSYDWNDIYYWYYVQNVATRVVSLI